MSHLERHRWRRHAWSPRSWAALSVLKENPVWQHDCVRKKKTMQADEEGIIGMREWELRILTHKWAILGLVEVFGNEVLHEPVLIVDGERPPFVHPRYNRAVLGILRSELKEFIQLAREATVSILCSGQHVFSWCYWTMVPFFQMSKLRLWNWYWCATMCCNYIMTILCIVFERHSTK